MLHKQTFAVSTLGNRGRGIATEHKAGLDAIIRVVVTLPRRP